MQKFYIMDLGKDWLILGYPFLYEFNPKIDWRMGEIGRGPIIIETARFKYLDSYVRTYQNRARLAMGRLKKEEAIYM